MRFATSGKRTSSVEVQEILSNGLWLALDGERWFLSHEEFPWFRNAPESGVRRVVRVTAEHLRWPALDVDLCVDSIHHPEKYPLKARLPSFS